MTPRTPRSGAFSLLELLIVIAVIACLMVISIPIHGYFRERSTGVSCMNNLRQIGAATMQYAGDHNNELPYYFYLVSNGTDTGNGSNTGAWYYNLAPYLNVPRTEVTSSTASLERTYLGTQGKRIASPCVFTCPGHRKTETKLHWSPHPMSWPTEKPVSYAPSLHMRGDYSARGESGWMDHYTGVKYYPIRFTDIQSLSQKVWITDSPVPTILNMVDGRWVASYGENWPRQAFSRHNKGGNALFFDGHVEWLPLSLFVSDKDVVSIKTIKRYFNPYRDPAEDM